MSHSFAIIGLHSVEENCTKGQFPNGFYEHIIWRNNGEKGESKTDKWDRICLIRGITNQARPEAGASGAGGGVPTLCVSRLLGADCIKPTHLVTCFRVPGCFRPRKYSSFQALLCLPPLSFNSTTGSGAAAWRVFAEASPQIRRSAFHMLVRMVSR